MIIKYWRSLSLIYHTGICATVDGTWYTRDGAEKGFLIASGGTMEGLTFSDAETRASNYVRASHLEAALMGMQVDTRKAL